MKIGVFDSGLGGLIIAHSLIQLLPEYDYVYLGDTARVPYGNRSQIFVTDLTKSGSQLASRLFTDKIDLELIDIKDEN